MGWRSRQRNEPGGRPHVVKVMLTEDEFQMLRMKASAERVSVQRLLVSSALADGGTGAGAVSYADRMAALAAAGNVQNLLAAIGNNANQMARVANSTGELPAADEFRGLAALTTRAITDINQVLLSAEARLR